VERSVARAIRTSTASLVGTTLLALGLARSASAQSAAPLRAPEPTWVTPLDKVLEPVQGVAAGRDTVKLLRDTRIHLTKQGVDRYHRYAAQALTASGVERLAEVLIEFNPAFQSLLLHRIGVWRDGRLLDQSKSATVRMVAQEDELERRVYNGALSAYVVLSDVRAGDIVDVSYTVRGENPALGARYAGEVTLASNDPVRHRHLEVLHDQARAPLHFKVRGTEAEPTHPNPELWVWDLHDVPATPDDDQAPPSTPQPSVQLSEFADWQDVARWGAALYPVAATPALTKQARELSAKKTDPEEIALALTRFVQDDIRYLAIATGENSLRPHPPANALAQRLGDCKDKAYLLMHLLRERGISAVPVLVDSSEKEHVADYLPTPFAFDHVILRVELSGQRYYIDATHSLQGGTLASQIAPEFGRGLALSPETTELDTITRAEPSAPERDTTTDITVNADESATIDVTTAMAGSAADDMRSQLADSSSKELGEQYANYYQRAFPELNVATPLEVSDARAENTLRLSEHYRALHFWRKGERALYPDSIERLLEPPRVVRRALPLAVEYPAWARETFNVKLPFASALTPSSSTIADAAMTYTRSVTSNGSFVSARHEYKSLAEVVPLASVSEHLATLQRARDDDGLFLTDGSDADEDDAVAPTREVSQKGTLAVLGSLGALLVIPAVIGIRWFVRRRRFRKLRDGNVGDTPARPALVGTKQDALVEMTRARCDCGRPIGSVPIDVSDLRFGGAMLVVGRVECGACGNAVRRYFSVLS
jgi:transglutaminase-like putative cysteine protease